MPNKQITDGNYRYNFQGQEKDPETGMEAFELRLWDGRLGRWLTVDPMGEFHSPYLGMGNNPVSETDPTGGSTEPPTDYVNEKGDLLLHTNDGSNAVVTVTNDKLSSFWSSVNSSTSGLDSRSWNFSMKNYLVGSWNQSIENTSSSIDTKWARKLFSNYLRTGSLSDGVKAEFAAAISQWTSPRKVIAGGMIYAGGLVGGVEAGVANETVGAEGAVWAQTTYGAAFSAEGTFAGSTISDVAGALSSGRLSVADVPIDIIVRNEQTFILNTRSSIALTEAGIPRSSWNVVNRTGVASYEARLTGQLTRNKIPNGTTIVRQSVHK